jgi:hypothetical protein
MNSEKEKLRNKFREKIEKKLMNSINKDVVALTDAIEFTFKENDPFTKKILFIDSYSDIEKGIKRYLFINSDDLRYYYHTENLSKNKAV